ncbi:MAG: CBS domain-containing protein [Thermoplasmata archaeon]
MLITGLISRTNIVRIVPGLEELRNLSVRAVMERKPPSIRPEESVDRAHVLMEKLNEKALAVTDESRRLVGVIGMSEIFETIWRPKAMQPLRSPEPPRKVFRTRRPAEITVGSAMSRTPVHVFPSDTIERVVSLMLDRGFSIIFVTEDEQLVGLVSQAQLMELVAGLRRRKGVYVRLSGLASENLDVYEALYEVVMRAMRRIDRLENPRLFTAHFATYRSDGARSKHSLGARLITNKGMYYARNADWDIYRALDSALETLEKAIRKRRERTRTMERKKAAG